MKRRNRRGLVDVAALRVSVIDGHWRMEGWEKLRWGCEVIEVEEKRERERQEREEGGRER